jgi:hypothetical protein
MATFAASSFYGRKRPSRQQSDDESDDDVGLPIAHLDSASDLSEQEVEESDHETGSEFSVDTDEDSEVEGAEEEDENERNYFPISKSGMRWGRYAPTQGRRAAHNIVTEQEGPTPEVIQLANSVEDCFSLYITDDMIEQIVRHTNQEIDRHGEGNRDIHGEGYWQYTDLVELKALFGLLISIGTTKGRNENVRDLWHDGPFSRSFFRAVMSRNRFEVLLLCIRFDDKRSREERRRNDKLAAISEIWNAFIANCLDSYKPGALCTIDEHMISFRGRCSFIMYLPSKPDKYGIKVFSLVCSHCYYLYNASIYTGKEGTQVTRNLGEKVVLNLTEPLANTSRNITMDNWFTSVPLADKLLQRSLTCVGTLKKNKPDIPNEMQPNRKRQAPSSLFGFRERMTLVSFVPKKTKAVILLSTMHHDDKVDADLSKPDIVLFYNETKGGVDTCDQMIKHSTVKRKTNRWPLAVFYRILDFACLNSLIIWRSIKTDSTTTRRQFLLQLSMNLARQHMVRRAEIPQLQRPVRQAMTICGIDVPRVPQPAAEGGIKRRCYICPRRIERKIRQTCSQCQLAVCKEHSQTETRVTCNNCADNQQ